MKSRILILFLTLLLFLTVFAAGTAAADTQFEDYFDEQNKQILGYNETIYINGDTVTIVNNFDSSGFPVRKFNDITYSGASAIPSEFNYYIDKDNETTTVQFNVSELGLSLTENDEEYEEFTLYLCGNIGGDYSNSHADSEIRFRVEKIFEEVEEPENGDEDNPVMPTYKLIVYPIQNGFTHDFNKPVYYSTDYSSVFTDEAVYLNLKEEFIGKNVIYSYDRGTLRSVYWYDAEASELNLTPSDSFNAYEPAFILNLSDLQDFNLNSIFICPEHDSYTVSNYNDASQTLTVDGIPYSDCASEFEWAVTIGDSEKDASNYLMTYDDLYPIEEEEDLDEDFDPAGDERDPEEEEQVDIISYPHFISFNSSALNSDLSKTRTQEIQFYPVLKTESDVEQQPAEPGELDPSLPGEEGDEDELFTGFKEKAYSFKFSRLYTSVSTKLPANEDTLQLVSETTDYSKPLVSSLSFPKAVKAALEDNSLTLESLNSHALDDVEDESGYLTPETSVLSVTDISFENSINDILKENNETVEVSFVIPTVINGVEINPNDIAVLHISDDGESKSLDKLETTVSPKNINGVKYYAVTAKTSGFSPFAVISAETPVPEPVSKAGGGQSFGEAVIVPSEEPVPADDKNGYENNLTPVTVIEDIITKIQGHLSVFSVLVVLTSGLFMWDYIRRRI